MDQKDIKAIRRISQEEIEQLREHQNTNRCFSEEIMAALLHMDKEKANNLVLDGCQFYSDKILASLNPVNGADLPYYIVALEKIAASFRKSFPEAVPAADSLHKVVGATSFSVPFSQR